jgi:hypothetical protein
MRTRGILTLGGYSPECAICGEPVGANAEMHEAIITRGGWTPLPEDLIMVRENCVLVHPGGKNGGTCHAAAHTEEGRKKCILHIVAYEGLVNVTAWLRGLLPVARSSVVENSIRLVSEAVVISGQ